MSGIPEWVELYNNDTSDLFLKGVYISDNTTRQYVGDIYIKSKGFIILSRDTISLKKVLQSPFHAGFIQTTLPVLNNTKDRLILSDIDGAILDSISYSLLKIYRGYSLERSQAIHDIFVLSSDPRLHTCGFVNSSTPINNDLMVETVYVHLDSIMVSIYNHGHIRMDSIDVLIRSSSSNRAFRIDSLQSKQKDSLIIYMGELYNKSGYDSIYVSIQNNHKDPRTYNDSINTIIYRSFPFQSIRINEINIKSGNYPEYVELYIADSTYQRQPITLVVNNNRIEINDVSIMKYILISTESFTTIHQQSSIMINKTLSINDKGGLIQIIDRNNTILDSFNYSPLITNYESYTGSYSFEYIDSLDNWQLSTNEHGGTPGMRNSSIRNPFSDRLIIENASHKNTVYNCNTFGIIQPFIIGVYSCDAYSHNGLFIKNIISGKLLPSESTIELPLDPLLENQLIILLHTVRDFHGSRICYELTPVVMRN